MSFQDGILLHDDYEDEEDFGDYDDYEGDQESGNGDLGGLEDREADFEQEEDIETAKFEARNKSPY